MTRQPGGLPDALVDEPGSWPVDRRVTRFSGLKWDVVTDTVAAPDGERLDRDYLAHPGAVAVVALTPEEHVLLVHQYRHPVAATLWELPAGLLDVPGEDPAVTAPRELWEETHHRADDWRVLLDVLTTPGASSEAVRFYVARGARPAEGDRHEQEGEERHMPVLAVPLDEAREAVLGGRVHNALLCVGVLAAWEARQAGWRTLRPLDAPWVLPPGRR